MNDDLEHAMNVLHINREGVSRLVYWPEVMKLFSCSTQLSTKFILLINVKMPT